jgi:hypothetical protein
LLSLLGLATSCARSFALSYSFAFILFFAIIIQGILAILIVFFRYHHQIYSYYPQIQRLQRKMKIKKFIQNSFLEMIIQFFSFKGAVQRDLRGV